MWNKKREAKKAVIVYCWNLGGFRQELRELRGFEVSRFLIREESGENEENEEELELLGWVTRRSRNLLSDYANPRDVIQVIRLPGLFILFAVFKLRQTERFSVHCRTLSIRLYSNQYESHRSVETLVLIKSIYILKYTFHTRKLLDSTK